MKILIVDDNPDLVQALKLGFKLQWPESQVVSAGDGERALAVFSEETPDIVLLDIAMPGMNGFEVLRRLRQVSDVPGGERLPQGLYQAPSGQDRGGLLFPPLYPHRVGPGLQALRPLVLLYSL